jgi:hypothetical protein
MILFLSRIYCCRVRETLAPIQQNGIGTIYIYTLCTYSSIYAYSVCITVMSDNGKTSIYSPLALSRKFRTYLFDASI